jgi:hypothetical protein
MKVELIYGTFQIEEPITQLQDETKPDYPNHQKSISTPPDNNEIVVPGKLKCNADQIFQGCMTCSQSCQLKT